MSRFINSKLHLSKALISIFILILLAGTSLSATYYVKNGGNDSADGLSDANAWASISKVNNKDLSAGDIVLFKKDSTWSDTLIPKSSGSAASPIIFDAYGTGAVPVININYNSSKHRNLYVNGKSNIQIKNLSFLNGTSEAATLYGNVEISNSSSIVLENIVVSGSFCKTAVLIANSSHDISVRNSTVETTSFPGSTNAEGAGIQIGDFSNFNTCYNVIVTGCDVKNNSGAGIVIFESYQNSIFENNVHGNGSAGIWVGGASGSYSHDNIIEKNRVYENCQYQDDAFGIDLYRVGDNNTVRYNLVHDQYDTVYNPSSHAIFNSHLFGSGGIRFDGNNTVSTLNVNGNIAHNNIVYNEYQGFQIIHINNVQIFNNTIYNNKTYSNTSYSSTGISVLSNYPSVDTHTSNTTVKNNIIYGKYWMVNDAYSSGTSFNNNVYFCTYDGVHIYFSHDGSGVDTFAGWKSATGYDSLSAFSDPKFVSATTDFYLQSSSPCINGGTSSGISVPSPWRDYDGKLISETPDIGAYEYDAPTSGSIYYVDAVNGSDSNNGTSTGTPWKTIDKVNETQSSLAAGNKVLFKRGQIFRKTKHNWTTYGVLTVKKSGTSGNPIVYGAYGSGPKPIISGSNTVGAWSVYSGNIWSASWVTDGTWDQPTQVFIDGHRGNKKTSTLEVTSSYDWYWNSNTLYLYSTSDPDTAFVDPGVEVSCIYNDSGCVSISSESYVVIKDLQFEKSRHNMVNLTYGTNNVTIENCSFFEPDPDYTNGAAAIILFTYSNTSAAPASSCEIYNCDFGKRTGNDLDDQKWAAVTSIRIKGRDNKVHECTFSHSAIENENSNAAYCPVIEMTDAHGLTEIYDNNIYHNAASAILVHGDDDGNTFKGLYFYGAGDVFKIHDNTVSYSALAGINVFKTRAATGHAGGLTYNGSNGAVGYIYDNDVSHCNRLANDIGANGIKGCGIHINDGVEAYHESDHPFIKWYVYQNRSYLHSSPANPKGEDTGGIALDLNSSGTEAFRNICYDNQGVGIYILSADGCKVYDNIFFGNDEGISVGGQAAPETAYNNQIFNNVCFKNYNGDDLGQNGIYDAEITIGDRVDGTKIKNNIFYGDPRSYVYRWWGGTSIEVSHNIVYNPGGNIEPYHTSWSSWNSLGFDTVGSLNTNPSLEAVNYSATLQASFPYITYPSVAYPDSNLNFSLKSNSLAINAGTIEGLALPSVWTDYSGTSVLQGARPDIGAYEYVYPAPIAPSSLTSEASTNTNDRIRLSWTDNSTNEEGFRIYASLNNVTFFFAATAEAGVRSSTITGLNPSTTYYFKVCAFNGGSSSSFSNTLTAVTYADPTGVKSSYYVDPTNGSNANSGSQASPWKTLSRLADYSFVSGDAIYLKRGGVWREELIFHSSGSASEPIVLDAYGAGAKPLILGSEHHSSWSSYNATPNLWTTGRLYLVKDYNCTNVGFIRLTQEISDPVLGTNIAQVVNSLSDVTSNGKFYYVTHEATSNGNVYGEVVIYCDDASGPISKWPDIEVGVRSRGLQLLGVSYVTVRNIDARYGTAGGFRIGDGSNHIVLESCEASYSGGTVTNINNIRAGDVVKIDRGSHDIEVKNCSISQTYDFGFSVETYDGNNDLYNITFESNTLDKCGGGIGINAPYYNPTSTSSIYNLHIKNNQITNTGYGWSSSSYNSGKGMAIYLSQSDQAVNQRIYNIYIYGNTIDRFQLNGIHMNDGGIYYIYKNTIKNGTLDYQASGDTSRVQNAALLIHGGSGSGDATRETSARIYGNLIYGNSGYGLTVLNNSPSSGTPEVFNNTFYGNGGASYPSVNIYYNSLGGVKLRNNIIYSANSRVLEVVSISPYFSSNYNCFYGLNGTIKVYYASADYDFSVYRSSLGQDANSILANPSFEAAGTNFNLRSVSQAVNAGTTEGISIPSSWVDYAGTSVPQGARPDIGAYEYNSSPVVAGTVKASGSGTALQGVTVMLLDQSYQVVSYEVTGSSGGFSLSAASMEGYLFINPPVSQNGQGYWIYQYQPRFYYKPAASNSGIDIRLPQVSTFIIEGRDQSNNLMDVASFEALRANVFSQYMSFVNMNDQIQPAMYWQVANSSWKAIPALMIDSSQAGGPFAVNMLFWQTASHGKIMLKADNDGSGFTLPSAGQATVINLNTELLKTVKKEMVNRTSHYNTYIPGDSDISLISSVSNLDDAVDLRDRLEYKAAQAAINVIRKGTVEVTAKDLSGKVIQNCTIEVAQTSHQFMFGAFEGTSRYTFHTFEADTDRKYAYSKAMEAGLGDITAVLPAWSATAGYGKTVIDQTWGITSLKALGYKVKFHGTLWFNLLMIPSSEVSNDPVTIAGHNRSFQNTIFGYFGDTGSIWESMNEPSFSNEINLSREAMISVLADSAATLNTNNDVLVNSPHEFDYGFKYAQYNLDNTLRTDYKLTYSDFLSRANLSNVDIIGLQFYPGFHMDDVFGAAEGPAMPPYWLVDTVNRYYSAFGKKIHITEFSVPSNHDAGWNTGYWKNNWDTSSQAEYVGRIFTLMYGTRSVDSIIWWDMLESESYLKYGGLLDTSKNPKPAYDSIKDLVKGSWTTTTAGTTAASGKTSISGFGGQYRISRVKLNQLGTIENPGISFYVTEEASGSREVVIPVYTLTATSGAHGTITPSGQVCVLPSGSKSFVITPEAGYRISGLRVDGTTVGTQSSYSFSNVAASHTVEVSFALNSGSYTISASSNTGGTISPSGTVVTSEGQNTTFTVTQETGYRITAVMIDGVATSDSLYSPYRYTLSNASSNHSIEVVFSANETPRGFVIWDGETGLTTDSYGRRNSTEAMEGRWCFEGAPNAWHSSAINLTSLPSYRKDISDYDEIWFYAKSSAASGTTFRVYIAGTSGTPRSVRVDDYIYGGILDNTYRLVRIPLSSFTSETYAKPIIQSINFGTAEPSTDGHKLYIDKVLAVSLETFSNTAPRLTRIGARSTSEGQTLIFTINATDENGDYLLYSATGLPSNSAFSSSTRTFSWVPGYDQSGTYNVIFTVSDGVAASTETVPITVNNVNIPPVLDPIGAKSVNKNGTLSFTLTSTDEDHVPLTYSVTNLPAGAVFVASTGAFSWSPSAGQSGTTYNVTFRVSDGSLTSTEVVPITVTNLSEFYITATGGTGGTISPSGVILTEEGNSMALTVTPESGYRIVLLRVDGVPVSENLVTTDEGRPYTYTFVNVAASHSIEASFAANKIGNSFVIWDGETAYSGGYGGRSSTEAYSGLWCLEATPTTGHAATLKLSGLPSYRQDFSGYDEIQFYAKANKVTALPSAFYVAGYGGTEKGGTVNILDYISGGVLDTTYRLVRIPVSALTSEACRLYLVDYMTFGNESTDGRKIYIDDIKAVTNTPTQVSSLSFISDKIMKLTVESKYDMDSVLTLSNYSVTSTNDSDFTGTVNPVQVGRHFYVTEFKGCKTPPTKPNGYPDAPIVRYELFIVFDKEMKNGDTYTITVNNIRDAWGNDFSSPQSFIRVFDDDKFVTGSVKANQVGYLPVSPKYAYVGNYLGDLGKMALSPSICQLKNAGSGSVVYQAAPTYKGDDTLYSGEDVYEFNFSSYQTPGTYYVYVPGFGRTYNFRIADDVFNDVATKTARFLYYQRSGTALDAQNAGIWARDLGHAQDAYAQIHISQTLSPLYNSEEVGSTVNLLRGWYDAADYGKYIASASNTLSELLNAFEMFPEKYADNSMNIPESGNGVPDILDEAKWELDWYKNMQAPDGGVFHKVNSSAWYDGMPATDDQTMYIAEKDTHSTANYVAIMAKSYRILYPYFPEYAEDLLARAERSWAFLKRHPEKVTFSASAGFATNPSGIGGGANADDGPDTDERAWAAAELYKSTGKKEYNDAFIYYWSLPESGGPLGGWNDGICSQKRAAYTYATTKNYPTDAASIEVYKSALRSSANTLVYYMNNNAYRCSTRLEDEVRKNIGWGSYSQSAKYSWDLIKASKVLNDTSYLDIAKINTDPQLGNNPQYKTYITGVGYDSPRNPHHKISAIDGVDDPVPGNPVPGVFDRMSYSNPFYAAVASAKNLYPLGVEAADPYPALRRYFDITAVVGMGESVIVEPAFTQAAYTYFSNMSGGPTFKTIYATAEGEGQIRPLGTINVIPGRTQTFSIVPSQEYRISDVVIDNVSVGPTSTYTFEGVSADHTVSVVFTREASTDHTITAGSSSGGSIVPNGAISVASGESQNFVITPESGYYIVNVAIDGANVGPITNYTFSNVTGDHSISVAFNNNWSRIYYVDSSSGSNTNTGTSETKAWQAISKVNEMAFRPGDSVKFKSGQTFAGSLNIYQSGTAVSPITFDAYNTGAKPVIDATGQQMGINIISASNVHIKNLEIKNATHPAGLSAGVAGNDSSDIILDTLTVHDCRGLAGIYFYDANTRITVKNSLVYNTKAVSDDARYAGIFGSGILMGGTDGQSNSNYHYILNNTSYGNANVGISVGNGSNNTISGNAVYNNGDCGIGLYGLLSSSNVIERNSVYGNCQYKDDRSGINLFRVGNSNIVRYNKTHSQYDTYNDALVHGISTPESASSRLGTCGIRFDGGDSGVTASTGNIVHTNLMTGEGDAYQVYNFANTQFFNNTIYNSKRFGILVNGSYAANTIVKNNIVSTMDGSATAGSYKHLIMVNGATSYNINNNLYFPDGATMFNLNETKTNFSSWKASQRDINSVLADPKFSSVPSANFALQNTSLAIDLGTTEGITLPSPWQDITGSTVPYAGTRPDAGAYESSVVVVSNTAPVMTAIGNKTTNEAQTLAFTVSATDSDGDTVTYEAVTLPSGATFNTTSGAFSWTPSYSQSGTYNPTFIARDGRGGSSQESITITVNNVNRAPVLTRIGAKTTSEAQTLAFTVSGTDEDGSVLTYTMTGTPSGASFNTSTRVFSWTPSYSQSGSYTVTFEVSDGSLSSSETVGITVNNVPRTFVITAIAGTGGSISPSGSVSVTEGNSQAFTITGNAGYSISNVLVDGSSQGAVGTYTFSNVTAVHTIEASFSMTLPSAPSGVTASAASVSQINVSWTDNANNEDGYRIQRSPNGTSNWTTIATVGAVASYNNTGLSPHTAYYYRVYSYNGSGVSAYSNTANATTSNSNPSLSAIGSKTTNEAQTLVFTISATDADGDTVTYEAVNLPTGATFNTTSGVFRWTTTYAQSGTYSNVTFKARDSYGGISQETITITVTNVNRAPVLSAIGSKGVNENSALSFTVSGTDEDGSALTYSATSLPSGASFNTSTRVFSWTPSYNQGGVYTPTFTVSDGSLTSSETITITVTNVNRAPVLSAIGSKGVNENSALSFTVSGTDEDGSALTYSATSLPSGASFNTSTRVFSWTPSYSQAGVYTPTFTVSDGSLTSSETITITVTNVNRAPVLSAIGSKGVNENSALSFTVSGTDEDGSALTYSATSLPSGASFNTSTRVFSWTPSYSQAGVYTPTFTVSDGSLTSSETITITVTNVNRTPVLSAIGSKGVNENSALTFTLVGSDADGNSLTYTMTGTPSGASLNTNTGVFNWTPTYSQSGNYSVTFGVTDGSLTDTEIVTITVSNVNRRPVLSAIGSKGVNENSALSFTVSGTDEDGSALTYSATSLPSGASFNTSTRVFSWTPSYSQAGVYTPTFTVSDGSLTSSETITITVTNVNRAPVANAKSVTVVESTTTQIVLTGSDPDGTTVTYSIVSQPSHGSVTTTATGLATYIPTQYYSGADSFTFRVYDGALYSTSATVSINVSTVNNAPVANAQTVNTTEDATAQIQLTGSDPDGDTITYSIVSQPGHGSVETTSAGLATYIPANNYNGADSFTFKVSDGNLDSNSAMVSMIISSVNDIPVTVSSSMSVTQDSSASVVLPAADADGDSLEYIIVSGPSHGTLSGSGANRTYAPASGYFGADSFTFKANDGVADSNTSEITITVIERSSTTDESVVSVAEPAAMPFTDVSSTVIAANWAGGSNPDGTLYYCENVTAGTNSGWITSTKFTSRGLSSEQTYEFRVKAKNTQGSETAWISLGSQKTKGKRRFKSVKTGDHKLLPGDIVSSKLQLELEIDAEGIDIEEVNIYVDGIKTSGSADIKKAIKVSAVDEIDIKYVPEQTLTLGEHSIRIEALDTAGDIYEESISGIKVLSSDNKAIQGAVLPYPNPYDSNAGELKVSYTLTTDIDIAIYIFDITGKLVSKREYINGTTGGRAGYNEITWDGKDIFGSKVENDIYLIRIVDKGTGKLLGKCKVMVLKK